jgi:hypothetical protein
MFTRSDGAETHPASAHAQFDRLKALLGEWDAPLPKNETMTDIFRPIGSGTAILHEEWKNGEQLTATVFYVVDNELRADHFCDLGNQLHYVAKPSNDPNLMAFELRDSTNLDTHPRHFHSTTWHLVDADHHTQDWEVMGGGRDAKVVVMEFTRKK